MLRTSCESQDVLLRGVLSAGASGAKYALHNVEGLFAKAYQYIEAHY
jgi:hypothetical protein